MLGERGLPGVHLDLCMSWKALATFEMPRGTGSDIVSLKLSLSQTNNLT
jgi:hypothetical protein